MNKNHLKAVALGVALAGGLIGAAGNAYAGAQIVINNINAPGVGFNDPTPAAPVGGNPGTTLGEQRLYAFTYAADQWGATLTSTIPIVISAQMTPLSCTSTSAVLGSAGATKVFRNFPNAPKADTWYSYALANKLSGTYQGTLNDPQISANFNSNLGQTGCLDGQFFYLGVDGQFPTGSIDFVTVLLHEMGHGIGFQTYTDGSTGRFNAGFPSIWDWYLMNGSTGKLWKDMTNAQRKASAISVDKLVWSGPLVTAALPGVLTQGQPKLTVAGPNAGSAAGRYDVGTASFGPPIARSPLSGQIMPVVDQPDGVTGLACNPLDAVNSLAVRGNIALIDRGTCAFTIKVKNAQNAGAIGVIIADNAPGSPPAGLGGSDPTITIAAVRVTQTDGQTIKAALASRTARKSGVIGSLALLGTQYQGADRAGHMLMFAPNPYQSGSSVSHYDVTAFRNQLMEPAINGDLTHSVTPPEDLTFPLLQDIGW
ncbi:MAG: peptidase [Proteobacteria bacterium]|nr:peptidase [Pseudomonadota bacterium]